MRNSPGRAKLFILCLCLVAIAAGIFFLRRAKHRQPPVPSQPQVEQDRKTIANPAAPEADLQGALVRLSEQRDADAKKKVNERVSSANADIRENSARALGFFTDAESLKTLVKLTADPDPSVRRMAIQAMGYRPSRERKEALVQILARPEPKLSLAERVSALGILARNPTVSLDERKAYLDQVFGSISGKEGRSAYAPALLELGGVASHDPRYAKLLTATLTPKGDKVDEETRRAMLYAIQALHRTCPENRYALLEHVLSVPHQDTQVLRSALIEFRYLKSPEGTALLKKAVAKKWFPENFQPNPRKILGQLEGGMGSDLCARH